MIPLSEKSAALKGGQNCRGAINDEELRRRAKKAVFVRDRDTRPAVLKAAIKSSLLTSVY